MHPYHCRAERNVGDDMSMAGLQVHSGTPPKTSSLGERHTPFKNTCQAQLLDLINSWSQQGKLQNRIGGARVTRLKEITPAERCSVA